MKILLADSFSASHAQMLKQNGHALTSDPALDGDSLVEAIQDNEVLVVRSTPVTAAAMTAAENLQLIIRAGAGTNTIDKAFASNHHIRVCNVPGANAIAVAELVIGLIITIDRHIADSVTDLRQGQWNKKRYAKARGLYGQKIGILGLGAIGFAVAQRAHAFGMTVFAVDKPGRSKETAEQIRSIGIVELESQNSLLGTCDIISLHLPLNEDTRRMVNASFLTKMKDKAILINTARGELVDETALIDALDSKNMHAGLDVYDNEPGQGTGTINSLLATHPNVCGTHHIGASTDQAQIAVADGVLHIIDSYEAGRLVHCVNP